jgi:hypothetical protein
MAWIGFIWLRIGTCVGLVWTRQWTFGFHKILGLFLEWLRNWQLLKNCSAPWVSEWGSFEISLSLFLLLPLWITENPWNALFHFSFLILRQSVLLLGRGISPSQGPYLNTLQHKHRKTHTHTHTSNIHGRSGIRTHDHSDHASEDSSCLRLLSCRDRRSFVVGT